LKNNPGIELHKRHSFFQFIKLVFHSEFIVTDGGSNQEECSYMGKPCLLLRKKTERTEGLDQNVCLSKLEIPVIDHFINHTNKYIRPFIGEKKSPSEVIADAVKHFA
jgi:UDP-N-acetylglucosamine 2-epimerase (non-hydrolysing)